MKEIFKVDSAGCYYGVYKWTNALGRIQRDLKLACKSENIALAIKELMNFDYSGCPITNGDVVKAMFPNETMFEQTDACTYFGTMRFDTEWWNALY